MKAIMIIFLFALMCAAFYTPAETFGEVTNQDLVGWVALMTINIVNNLRRT